jgi:hypothetical protein
VVWSATEAAVTLACIAIPTLVPLYFRATKTQTSSSERSAGYRKHSQGVDNRNASVELQQMKSSSSKASRQVMQSTEIDDNRSDEAILASPERANPSDRRPPGVLVTSEVVVSINSRKESKAAEERL